MEKPKGLVDCEYEGYEEVLLMPGLVKIMLGPPIARDQNSTSYSRVPVSGGFDVDFVYATHGDNCLEIKAVGRAGNIRRRVIAQVMAVAVLKSPASN